MSFEPKRPVTVEDLLRLKRAERPAVEFWEQFDRKLRAKQLAALVEKRPWWRDPPRIFAGWRRYYLPLGATAALVITFVTLRDRPAVPASGAPIDVAALAAAAPAKNPTSDVAASGLAAAVAPDSVRDATSKQENATIVAAADPAPSALDLIAPMSRPVPAAGSEMTPSGRGLMANLLVAQTQAPEPGLARGILSAPVVPASISTPAPVEPLAHVASASGSRYARLRTAMATPVVNTMIRATDRVARELSDERLSEDAIRRFAAKGDRLSVKF